MKFVSYGFLIDISVEPKSDFSRRKLDEAVVEIADDDSSFTINTDDNED